MAASKNVTTLVNVLKLLKFEPELIHIPGAVAGYNLGSFSEGRLKLAIRKANWEPQAPSLFPDPEGYYFIAAKDGDELAVISKHGNKPWVLEFSGY